MSEVEKQSREEIELENLDVRKIVRQQLENLRGAGLTHLPKGQGNFSFDWSEPAKSMVREVGHGLNSAASPGSVPTPLASAADKASKSDSEHGLSTSTLSPPDPPVTSGAHNSDLRAHYGPSLGLADRKSALKILKEEVAECTRCSELSRHRTQTVFGIGNPTTKLVFVGEGPGAQEDRLGEPFVGAAGKLLDKIINACKLSKSEVYILNSVKCRPPGNRNPSRDELSNCWGYAERQLEIIQPEFICCLGSVAARTLLQTTQSLGRLRKQFHLYRGSRVLVTYHPAYLLRTPSAKRHVWEDMQMLMKEMGVDLSN